QLMHEHQQRRFRFLSDEFDPFADLIVEDARPRQHRQLLADLRAGENRIGLGDRAPADDPKPHSQETSPLCLHGSSPLGLATGSPYIVTSPRQAFQGHCCARMATVLQSDSTYRCDAFLSRFSLEAACTTEVFRP